MSLWTLAFKNDVSFFRGREAYQGLSSRSLATDALYASGLGLLRSGLTIGAHHLPLPLRLRRHQSHYPTSDRFAAGSKTKKMKKS